MADECLPQLQAIRMRVAVLDGSGVPDPGTENMYVSSAMTQVTLTPTYRDGDEFTEVNAAGELCLDYRGDDNLRRADIAITLCSHDPYLMAVLGGGTVLEEGDAIGAAAPAIGIVDADDISVEVWTKRINDGVLDADFPYARWVMPRIRNLREGEHTFENGTKMPQFTGQAYENPNWFDGPANDWPAASDRIWQWLPVTAGDAPAAVCGPIELAAS